MNSALTMAWRLRIDDELMTPCPVLSRAACQKVPLNVGKSVGQLNVLGGVSCSLPDGTAIHLKGRRTRELLASLALTGTQPELRDRISGRLWPDCSARNARKALNTTLWRLRGTFKEADTDPARWIKQDNDTLALADDGGPSVDLVRLKQMINVPQLPVAKDDATILGLYSGKFAEGLDAEWIEVERRKLHQQFTTLLRRAAETLSASHRLQEAMSLAEALVQDDPLDEGARHLLVRLQLESGNRGKAVREYSELETVLRKELGVAPAASTQALFNSVGIQDRSYRIEADSEEETERPGFHFEGIEAEDRLLRQVTELRDMAEKLMDGLSALEAML